MKNAVKNQKETTPMTTNSTASSMQSTPASELMDHYHWFLENRS